MVKRILFLCIYWTLVGCQTTPDGGDQSAIGMRDRGDSTGAMTTTSEGGGMKREQEACPPGTIPESEDAPSVAIGVETDIPPGEKKPRVVTRYKCRSSRPAHNN